jgi:hypothetical protein
MKYADLLPYLQQPEVPHLPETWIDYIMYNHILRFNLILPSNLYEGLPRDILRLDCYE